MADQEQTRRGRGRPSTYATPADRARAWRQRQKDLIAQGQQPAAPVVVEKIVEKVIEKVIEIPVDRSKSGSASKRNTADAQKLFPTLQDQFGAYGGEDRAKRLRTNAAKAASTAREIIGMLDHKPNVPETEKNFLLEVAIFFENMNGLFHGAQGKAKQAKAMADAEYQAKRTARIEEAILLTFGQKLDLAQVTATAKALQAFASREVQAENAKRLEVDRSYFFINREYELRTALKAGDAALIAREVADIRLEAGERGRRWNDKEEICYSAGWSDFEKYRTNEMASFLRSTAQSACFLFFFLLPSRPA